jgi:hypothetical protein
LKLCNDALSTAQSMQPRLFLDINLLKPSSILSTTRLNPWRRFFFF